MPQRLGGAVNFHTRNTPRTVSASLVNQRRRHRNHHEGNRASSASSHATPRN